MADLIPPRGEFFSGYNGTNIIAAITIPGEKPYVFAELQTVSYSVHREKRPVRVIGQPDAIAYTYGPRTIAGSLIFATLEKHVVLRAMKEAANRYRRLVADQLPPFHITIFMADEYGNRSRLTIYNCSIVDEGQIFSVEDIVTETTMSYVATGIDLLNIDEPRIIPTPQADHDKPSEVQEEEYSIISGHLIPEDPNTSAGGVTIIVTGDGFRRKTQTDPEGKYILKIPKAEGPIRMQAHHNGYHQDLGESIISEAQEQPKVELQSDDRRNFPLGAIGIDPYSIRVWVNGRLVERDSPHSYIVDPIYGVISFNEALGEDDKVEASFRFYNEVGSHQWSPPPQIDGIAGHLLDPNGDPVVGKRVLAETETRSCIVVKTDEDGYFKFENPESKIEKIRVQIGETDWLEVKIEPIDADSLYIGPITVAV